MAKFSNYPKGTRAIHIVKLPLVNTPGPYQDDQKDLSERREKDTGSKDRIEIDVGIRALTPGEQASVNAAALAYAKAAGVDVPDDRSPIYSMGYNLNVLAIAAVDPESDPKKPVPFFGTGTVASAIEEMLGAESLTRDSIVYLAEQQELWQDTVSPTALKLSPEQLWDLMSEVHAEGASPFLRLRLGAQLQFMQFSVNLLWSALMLNSPMHSTSSEFLSSSQEKLNELRKITEGGPA